MLNEQYRIKLDGIIKQMINNKEPENAIKAVVDDFKSKYDVPEKSTIAPDKTDKPGFIKRGVRGAAKGVASTLTGMSSLGERFIRAVLFSKFEPGEKTSAEKIVPEGLRTPTEDEKFGFMVEQIAEFFIPIPGLRKAKAASLISRAPKIIQKVVAKAPQIFRFIKKAGESTAEFSARVAAQQGEFKKEDVYVGASAIVVGGVLTEYGAKVFKQWPQWLMSKAIGKGD